MRLPSTPEQLAKRRQKALDLLGSGTLNEHQRETVQALQEGILSLETSV